MGPIILLDKSALQCLSSDEVLFLTKHYFVNIPPILILEILGDLSKYGDDKIRSQGIVRMIAKKLSPVDSRINADYRGLVIGSLLGGKVPMTGQVILTGGREVTDRFGRKGVFFEEPPEARVVRRWQSGDFTTTEEVIAEKWRQVTTALDLEGVKRLLRGTSAYDKDTKTLKDLMLRVDEALAATGYQAKYIDWLLGSMGADAPIARAVFERYQAEGFRPLAEFAAYAYYCCKVSLAFSVGLANNLVGTKSTNRIDLEYLMYLPFCYAFASGDGFLKEFGRLFLRSDQDLVDSIVLKKDLSTIVARWARLTEKERDDDAYNYGSYPPINEESFTYAIWKKRMGPWSPGSGNRAGRMTKEEQEKLMEHLRPMLEAIDRLKEE